VSVVPPILAYDRSWLHGPRGLGSAGHSDGAKQRPHPRMLGDGPMVFAVADMKTFNTDRSVDREAAEYIAAGRVGPNVVEIADLRRLADGDLLADAAVAVLHPVESRHYEAVSEMIGSGSAGRVFVLVWTPRDGMRAWLDGHGAVDLHTGASVPAPDPLQVAAAAMMVGEQYNGLRSGRGKDVVVQLLRAFTDSGYPLDEDAWLRAFFAAGGGFRHADSVRSSSRR